VSEIKYNLSLKNANFNRYYSIKNVQTDQINKFGKSILRLYMSMLIVGLLSTTTHMHAHTTGLLSGFWPRGIKMRCNGILGGKVYDPDGSKTYDKLGDLSIIVC